MVICRKLTTTMVVTHACSFISHHYDATERHDLKKGYGTLQVF